MSIVKKPWFKAKTYGWGWQPATWQGWLVMLVWLVLEIVCVWYLSLLYGTSVYFVTVVVGCSLVVSGTLLCIVYVTGEKPAWKWGDTK
jgi:hypothetical protein